MSLAQIVCVVNHLNIKLPVVGIHTYHNDKSVPFVPKDKINPVSTKNIHLVKDYQADYLKLLV